MPDLSEDVSGPAVDGGPIAYVSEAPPGGPSRGLRSAIEWVAIIGVALLAAFVIKTYAIQAFYIPSSSMEHTLDIGDRVLVNKISYHLHDVHRGDIVVFERPPAEAQNPAIKDLIKRVIGLPGERVEGRDGKVFVNGRALREPYLAATAYTSDFAPYKVPASQYWVMGDNRTNSADSRVFKSISRSLIVGKAFVRVWPVTTFRFF